MKITWTAENKIDWLEGSTIRYEHDINARNHSRIHYLLLIAGVKINGHWHRVAVSIRSLDEYIRNPNTQQQYQDTAYEKLMNKVKQNREKEFRAEGLIKKTDIIWKDEIIEEP